MRSATQTSDCYRLSASSMGVALENARLFDETKRLLTQTEQRASELAIINEIGAALSEQLDFNAIVDLVGDRLASLFKASDFFIALHDRTSDLIRFPYELDHGQRVHGDPIKFGEGLTSLVIRERRARRYGTFREGMAMGAVIGTYAEAPISEPNESWLGVPIMAGRDAIGVVVLGDTQPNMFTEADERLVATIASNLGVALENARLFDETKRLLTETNERAAELAIINSVQQGLAEHLEMQAMYDLVGDKLHEIFDPDISISIGLYDVENELLSFPYVIERGERLVMDEAPFGVLSRMVSSRVSPLQIDDFDAFMTERGSNTPSVGERPKSMLQAPLLRGGKPFGRISLENMDRLAGFTDADLRLLTTLAGSLSVALENARLFGETQRLLTETNERAAELAIINSVQQGLAAKLDMQSMYDLVGDKIQEIFDAQVVDIALLDLDTQTVRFPYSIERGVRSESDEVFPIGALGQVVVATRAHLLINDIDAWQAETGTMAAVPEGEPAKSVLFAPMHVGADLRGYLSLQNLDHKDAFTESDVRLLTTLAGSLSVALENARLFAETERLLKETNERAAELAIINSVQQGLAAKLDMQAMYDLVGDKIAEIFDAQVVDISALRRRDTRRCQFAVHASSVACASESSTGDLGPMTRRVARDEVGRSSIDDVEAWARETGSRRSCSRASRRNRCSSRPWLSGQTVRGHLSLQNLDRTDAFSDVDVRLLTTLAGSLSVALENARLFDETKRLLTETNERAAELAIINSVQQGLAEKLDMQAMYDLVGDKIQEIFDAQVVDIGLYDVEQRDDPLPLHDRARRALSGRADAVHVTRRATCSSETTEPLVLDDVAACAEESGLHRSRMHR